jgi:hypothetical protein
MSTTKAEHLRAHASRLLAFADRFRHGGHNAPAEDLETQAAQYLDEAERLDAPDRSMRSPHLALRRIEAGDYKPGSGSPR